MLIIGKISVQKHCFNLLFKYAYHKNKRSFVLTANEALVGTLMTIGDVNNIFPIQVMCIDWVTLYGVHADQSYELHHSVGHVFILDFGLELASLQWRLIRESTMQLSLKRYCHVHKFKRTPHIVTVVTQNPPRVVTPISPCGISVINEKHTVDSVDCFCGLVCCFPLETWSRSWFEALSVSE